MLHVLNQRLDRGKTCSRCQQHHGFVRVFTQKETAVRPFDTQNVFFFHGGEHRVSELAAGHVANMQLHFRGAWLQSVGRIAHAVAAAGTIAEQKFNVLTCVELHHIGGRQLQMDHHHIV